MNNLYLSNKKIESIFQLLGEHENDMSYSLAWGLDQCHSFLEKFLSSIINQRINLSEVEISLQKISKNQNEGITDIEIKSKNKFFIIIEAKRGFNYPHDSQLKKYTKRLKNSSEPIKRIIVLSEYNAKNSSNWLKKEIEGIPIQPISWREAVGLAKKVLPESSHAQKHLIRELIIYFNKIMTKQIYDSNWVYVVALGHKTKDWRIPPFDVVTKDRKFFHPIGTHNWPKEPVNYIAFRHGGRLLSIHHVDKYEVTRKVKKWLAKTPNEELYLYSLGPAIKPNNELRNGKIYPNGHVWCMLDTLLTSKTIFEARNISHKRESKDE